MRLVKGDGLRVPYYRSNRPFADTPSIFTPDFGTSTEAETSNSTQLFTASFISMVSAFEEFMAPTRTVSALTIPPSPMLEVEQRGGGVDWNDPRKQSWTWDNRLVNTRYISAVTELYIAEKRLGDLYAQRKNATLSVPSDKAAGGIVGHVRNTHPLHDMIKKEEENVAQLDQAKNDAVPRWMGKKNRSFASLMPPMRSAAPVAKKRLPSLPRGAVVKKKP